MKRIIIATLILLMLASCSRPLPATKDILNSILVEEKNLPDGDVFLSGVTDGESFASDSLLLSLYSDDGELREREEWIEFAIFLSRAPHPCEFAVILCSSPSSVTDTQKLLCRRLNKLKKAWSGTAYSAYTEDAEVLTSGNFCILLVSSDTKAARKAFSASI